MNTINFIYQYGGESALLLLFKTENGFLFASHIDHFSKAQTEFYSLLGSELLSIIPGDAELIEVTQFGYEIIKAYFPGSVKCRKERLTMEKQTTNNGIEYFNFEMLP